jgi:hypothetical protein
VGRKQSVDGAVAGDALTVPAPADPGVDRLCGESITDLTAKTAAGSFRHLNNYLGFER